MVRQWHPIHYIDVMMGAIAFHTIVVSIACSTVCSEANQRKHRSSVPLAFLEVIH